MQNITTYDAESPFDQIKQVRADGSEFWSARDLMAAMGYRYWKNFETPLQRAISSARNQQQNVEKNFTRSGKKWETLPEFYRNQYRRIARAVIDHVMPSPDLFSQEES